MMFYVIQDGLTLYGKTYFHAPPELGSKLAVPAATNRGFLFIMSYHEMGKRDRLFADVFIWTQKGIPNHLITYILVL